MMDVVQDSQLVPWIRTPVRELLCTPLIELLLILPSLSRQP